MENISVHAVVVKESIVQLYDQITAKISPKKVLLPLSGICFVYYFFIRKCKERDTPIIVKEPCRPDQPYTGHEEPKVRLKFPVLENWLSIAIARRLFASVFGRYLLNSTYKKSKLYLPDARLPEVPTYHPIVLPDGKLCKLQKVTDDELWGLIQDRTTDVGDEFHFTGVSDLITLYRNKKLTPLDVANSILQALKSMKNSQPDPKAIINYDEKLILEAAKESTMRWASGKVLSVFDGIPVAVKDEYPMEGYPVRNGLPIAELDKLYTRDDEKGLVKKLREGGAIFIGISNMHQIGIGTFGINQSKHHGTSRNPYNTNYSTSGSSGGSAASIALGLCPLALGSDGGGSIRLPAAACGVVGLKATFGRYSNAGRSSYGSTVTHSGPLCCSVRDTAIAYGFLAGKDEDDCTTLSQPPVHLGDFEDTNLKSLRIGVDYNWLEDSDPELKAGFKKALDWLVTKHNATVVSIHLPEKEEFSRALTKTITGEMGNLNDYLYETYYDELNIDVISSLRVGRSVSAKEFLQCARQRTRSMNAMKYIFSQVDVFMTPAFEKFQPVVTPSREKYGYSNLNLTVAVCRFVILGNLTGIPAITLPVDYNKDNLPIPVQIMASWWREDLLLKVANAIESHTVIKEPQVHFEIAK